MRAGSKFLLLLAAVCAVSATSDARPSYKEALAATLGQQAAASVRLNSADHYHGVDHVCFTATQTCGNYWWLRSHLSCCKHDTPYYEKPSATEGILSAGDSGPTVGTCQTVITGGCWPLGKNLNSYGTFQTVCDLYGDAGACGPHDCGDLVLTAQGQALGLSYAIIKGDRTTDVFPNTDDGCVSCYTGTYLDESYGTAKTCEIIVKTDAAARQNATAPGLRAKKRGGDTATEPKVLVAEHAYILSGPVTIASKSKETKWVEGWMEYVYAEKIELWNHETCEDMESKYGGKLPFIDSDDFNNYKFQLYKNKGHY